MSKNLTKEEKEAIQILSDSELQKLHHQLSNKIIGSNEEVSSILKNNQINTRIVELISKIEDSDKLSSVCLAAFYELKRREIEKRKML